jgi:hypothetical protein
MTARFRNQRGSKAIQHEPRGVGTARWALLVVLTSLLAGCAMRQVKLDGDDEVFSQYGQKTFARSKAECFEATKRVFKSFGHGVDRENAASGTIVSGKMTVLRSATATGSTTAAVETTVSNKFYVSVAGDDTRCTVKVVRLRAWTNMQERDTETYSWTGWQLKNFIESVQRELAELDRPGSGS